MNGSQWEWIIYSPPKNEYSVTLTLIPNRQDFRHLQNTNKDLFCWNLRDLKRIWNELSGLVKNIRQDTIALYDQQIEFSHLRHSSTHTSVVVNVSSSMSTWSVGTNDVHSRVAHHVWASAWTNEVCSCVSRMFGWASVYAHCLC